MRYAILLHQYNPNRTVEPPELPWVIQEVEDDVEYQDGQPWIYKTKEQLADLFLGAWGSLVIDIVALAKHYKKEIKILHVKQRIRDARNYGQDFIDEFGARNVVEGKTPQEMAAMAKKLAPIQSLMQSGSLKLALAAINALEADTLITVDMKKHWKEKLEAFLNA